MKENFSNLAKEIDIQVQETESQTSWTQRGPHQDTSIKMLNVKDKEKPLKAAREKAELLTKEFP